jgi:hypothetical protein
MPYSHWACVCVCDVEKWAPIHVLPDREGPLSNGGRRWRIVEPKLYYIAYQEIIGQRKLLRTWLGREKSKDIKWCDLARPASFDKTSAREVNRVQILQALQTHTVVSANEPRSPLLIYLSRFLGMGTHSLAHNVLCAHKRDGFITSSSAASALRLWCKSRAACVKIYY